MKLSDLNMAEGKNEIIVFLSRDSEGKLHGNPSIMTRTRKFAHCHGVLISSLTRRRRPC